MSVRVPLWPYTGVVYQYGKWWGTNPVPPKDGSK